MSRRIEHSASYLHPAALLHGALTDRSYWQARIDEVGGPGATLNGFDDTEGGVRVQLTQVIAAEHLPAIVAKLKSGSLHVERTETWGPLDSMQATASFDAAIVGTPIKLDGTHRLGSDGASCTIRTTGRAQVSVPVIGGKIEQIIAENINRLLVLEQHFTEQWLAKTSS